MNKLNSRRLLAIVLSTALLAACGGGNSTADTPAATPPGAVVTAATEVAKYFKDLFASADENSDPKDANLAVLAEDDSAEPEAIN